LKVRFLPRPPSFPSLTEVDVLGVPSLNPATPDSRFQCLDPALRPDSARQAAGFHVDRRFWREVDQPGEMFWANLPQEKR